ncbi:MAG: PEP-CTERM sorting domain-containing protein [Planctomycetes bacterium]|nr:PEP-CTERM sorting domain-containing protein [Planctomycetota bacterium]
MLLAAWTGPGPAGSPAGALAAAAVPEPGTFLLAAFGLVGLLSAGRRRRKDVSNSASSRLSLELETERRNPNREF